jgi:hypothetical protein
MEESQSDSGWSNETIGSEEEEHADRQELHYVYYKAMAEVKTVEDVYKIIHLESQDRMEEIVSKGLHKEAAKILKVEKDPLKGLRRILRYMRLEQLPVYNLRNDTCEVVQAINYCMFDPTSTGQAFSLRMLGDTPGQHAETIYAEIPTWSCIPSIRANALTSQYAHHPRSHGARCRTSPQPPDHVFPTIFTTSRNRYRTQQLRLHCFAALHKSTTTRSERESTRS